ncbi:hypothetical protein SELMODRAFT_178120 [Selaginella moellendorffii]|uniref:Uncharacterized protein n=1 Tax=Selaginella moellendorffii TaxID=88036 RepID=D8SAL9_SELML|nr:hypothetical protein SELMODRAFT_178120 [Selaginella moellendorffii]
MHEEEEDVGRALLNRFHNSPAPEHKQLLAVVSAVMEVLKEQGLPLIPTAYFAATMAPLEQQCNAGAVDGADTTAFLTFLATLLPKLPASVLRSTSGKALVVLDKVLGDAKLPAATAKPALSCIECILCAADRSSWPALAGSFQLLLKFCVDMRPKVRRRAHLCAAQVLSSFHGSAALDKASDLVASSFEECASPFLAKGKSNEDAAAGALKLLHMIGAMRLLLPAMSPKTIARVLPSITLLITLKQSLVTRSVLNVLLSLGRRSRTGVSSAALVGVIRAVLSLVAADNRDVDEVMTAVHVIEQGLSNLYAIDPKLCAGQLPAPFDAITDLFASEQEEVVFGAAECLRGLADRFIDGAMLRQLETDPVAIESICSSVERSLSYEYSGAWDKALLVVSALFQKMGEASFRFMKGIVKVLAELQKLRDEDLPYFTFDTLLQLHNSFGAAVVAMGPERFLELLPLDMDATQLDKARIWLIPILKQHLVGARLKYFATTIGPLAESLAVKAHERSLQLAGAPAKNAEACAQALWALLPSFCNYPVDTKDSFQVIAKLLGESMRKYPDLRGVISSSIQTLIKQNKSICDANDGMDVDLDAKEKACYSKDIASANLSAISAFSDKFLPLLFNIFCESPPEKRGELQAAIGAFASISSKATVQKFFRTVMEKLLEATKDTNAKERRCMFMDLALSLVGGLDHKGLSALFAVAKPALQDPDSGVQKKGYKVLAGILKEHTDFLSSKEQEIFEAIVEATSACQSSAKQYRVACLQLLILHLVQQGDENTNDYIAFLLKESVLALKENNKKTRDRAYELLIGIGNGLLQVSDEKLVQFFRKLVGCSAVTGSAGEPHVISAALSAISRMVYEFPSELKGEIHRYLPSAFYLLRNYKSREVIKSVLGLLKVIVAMMSKEELMPRLSEMVEAMMVWSDDPKNRFKAKVRGILEKLLKKCGFEAVSAVMPKEHAKHLVNIRKRKDHEEKKKRSIIDGEDDKRSHFTRAPTTRSKWKHTDIFSDSDEDNDGDDESEGATAFTRSKATTASRSKKLPKQKRRLPEDERGRDEPLDLLDVSKTRAALSTLGKPKKSQAESDEDMDFDPDGRLIVEERQPQQQQQGRASKRLRDEEEEGEEEEFGRSQKGAKKRGKVAAENQKKRSTGWSYKGDEYVNKKGAGGDVKRDGKLEPYAYWPLDAKLLNRRGEKKAAARKGMESVFKVTKKLEGLSVNKALGGIQKKRKKQHNKAHKSGANSKSARSKR